MFTKCHLHLIIIISLLMVNITIGEPKPQQQMPQVPQIQQYPTFQQMPIPVQEGKSCLHTFECDSANTVLSCERGKCICPMRPQMQWTRGIHPLNTAWDLNLRKCLSVKDSACDVYNPKSVYCSQGLVCRAASTKDGFGLCVNGARNINSLGGIIFASIGAIILLQYHNL